MIKPVWMSKTVLFNLITFAALVLPLMVERQILPLEYAAFLIPLVNIILRVWFTAAPLTEQAANKEADRIEAAAGDAGASAPS